MQVADELMFMFTVAFLDWSRAYYQWIISIMKINSKLYTRWVHDTQEVILTSSATLIRGINILN